MIVNSLLSFSNNYMSYSIINSSMSCTQNGERTNAVALARDTPPCRDEAASMVGTRGEWGTSFVAERYERLG